MEKIRRRRKPCNCCFCQPDTTKFSVIFCVAFDKWKNRSLCNRFCCEYRTRKQYEKENGL